ncbi:T6SS immunity protein Tli4 family protein [Cupriavidus sp. UME77]|uniref:T6SS immunity protein Tli4 family protein n=1 Tax=Cupriavidus sp. UME77 TaxID=1862321 RepID=UPI001603DC6C
MNELTVNLGPRCVGRYLIDMPADVFVFGNITVDQVPLEATAMPEDQFQREVASREAELKGTRSADAYPFLYASGEVSGAATRYFIHRGDALAHPASRVIEAYKWDRGFQIKTRTEGWDYTNLDRTNDSLVELITPKNIVPELRARVFDLLKRVRGRPESEIPSEPGVCFFGGFLPGKAGATEKIWSHFVLHDKIDVRVVMNTDSDIQEPTTLLQRGDSINAALKEREGRTIRKGPVDLPGLQAEEWLMAAITTRGVPGHHLVLEANSRIGSAQTPLVILKLDTGSHNKVLRDPIEKASLTEGEAVAFWDVVSRTLRPRPNGF